MTVDVLSQTRQYTYESLTPKQQDYLDHFVKRGRKTKWLNILAAYKGVAFTEEELNSDTSRLLEEVKWELVEVEDAGAISKDLRCECGKALRFRYTVLNRDTGVLYKLGSEHLEQYTSLDAQTVKAVVKGIKQIDLERDELLDKCQAAWVMPQLLKHQIRRTKGFRLPTDVQEQLDLDLPLLERQLKRLKRDLKAYIKDQKTSDLFYKTNVEAELNLFAEEAHRLNKERLQASLPPFSLQSFQELLEKLQRGHLKESEAKLLLGCIAHQKNDLLDHQFTLDQIKQIVNRSLGQYGTAKLPIRNLLFDILEL